jgi:hypothetical protein
VVPTQGLRRRREGLYCARAGGQGKRAEAEIDPWPCVPPNSKRPIAPFGTSDEMRPACIVHRTRSDRRLGTHLLSAIELLLPLLVDESQWRADVALSYFPPARPKDGGERIAHLFPTSSLMYFRMIHMLSPDQAEWDRVWIRVAGLSRSGTASRSRICCVSAAMDE